MNSEYTIAIVSDETVVISTDIRADDDCPTPHNSMLVLQLQRMNKR